MHASKLDEQVVEVAAEAEEVRLNLDDSAPVFALMLEKELRVGCQAYEVQKLLTGDMVIKRGRRMSGKQIYQGLAQLGWLYLNAVKAARDQRLSELKTRKESNVSSQQKTQ